MLKTNSKTVNERIRELEKHEFRIGGHNKKYYRALPEFSEDRDALFNSAWRKMLSLRNATDINTENEVIDWMQSIIAEKVNDSRSQFYIHG